MDGSASRPCHAIALIFAALIVVTASAQDWRRELSPAQPGKFPAPRPLHATYKFGWAAFSAAKGDFDFSKSPKTGLLRLSMKSRTSGIVRALYRLDAQHVAVARPATLRPVNSRQTEAYSDETIRTSLEFDGEGVTRVRQSLRPDAPKGKAKRFDFPAVFDLHSAFLWIRSQRLAPGDRHRIVVYPGTSPYLADVTVVGRETIEVADRNYTALKLDLRLQRITNKLALEPHRKFKSAWVWVSDDSDRLLLKAAGEIFVGAVWTELDSIEFKSR